MTINENACCVVVTERLEFAARDSVCVGVRSRESGEWLDHHYALGSQLNVVAINRPLERTGWAVEVENEFFRILVGPLHAVEKMPPEILRRALSVSFAQRHVDVRAAG